MVFQRAEQDRKQRFLAEQLLASGLVEQFVEQCFLAEQLPAYGLLYGQRGVFVLRGKLGPDAFFCEQLRELGREQRIL